MLLHQKPQLSSSTKIKYYCMMMLNYQTCLKTTTVTILLNQNHQLLNDDHRILQHTHTYTGLDASGLVTTFAMT